MNIFIQFFRMRYLMHKLTDAQIDAWLAGGGITREQADYIKTGA